MNRTPIQITIRTQSNKEAVPMSTELKQSIKELHIKMAQLKGCL